MTLEFKTEIAERVRSGESMQHVANDYGVSRERIRQIAIMEGVTGASVRAEKKLTLMEYYALDIVLDREQWIPARFGSRAFSQYEFQVFLKKYRPELYVRWNAAKELPVSKSGRADPSGQICIMCETHKPWDEFYSDRSRPSDKALRCKLCAKEHADGIRRARNVTEPTVLKKLCRRCGKTKAASKFSRSLTSPKGLQQYCKQCQSEYEKDRRAK